MVKQNICGTICSPLPPAWEFCSVLSRNYLEKCRESDTGAVAEICTADKKQEDSSGREKVVDWENMCGTPSETFPIERLFSFPAIFALIVPGKWSGGNKYNPVNEDGSAWFLKKWWLTSLLGVTWKLVRNANPQVPLLNYWIRNLHLNSIPRGFIFTSTFEKHWCK